MEGSVVQMRTLWKTALLAVAGALLVLSLFVLWLVFPSTPADGRSVRFQGFVDLPRESRTGMLSVLDYLSVDDGRLFVTNVSTGTIYKIALHGAILPAASDISTLALEPEAHGVVIDPVTRLAYATRSTANTVDIFDPTTMRLVKRLPVADDADGIFYVTANKMIYVANGDAHFATLIDPASQRVVATIALGAKPEFGAFDGKTKLFYQNLEDTSALAAVDLARRAVEERWSLQPCLRPTGMAIDERRRQLFIGCSGNAMLAVFSLDTHRIVAIVPLAGGPDAVAYDETLQRVYATGREGKLSVVSRDGRGGFVSLDTIGLHYGAHTLAIDPSSHWVYVGYASLFVLPRLAVFAPSSVK
jgi:YVTN family beta-propeller protein